MTYVDPNFKTKKALREAITSGQQVRVFQPGPFGPDVTDGDTSVEGPHYPAPPSWYARVRVENGLVVKVLS